MGLKPDATDEIGGTSRPLVEVPIPLSDKVAEVLAGLFLAGTIPVLVGGLLYLHLIEPLLRPLPALFLCILFLGHLAYLRSCLVRASRPEFAVGKDGLRRRVGRCELHYEWDEVSYCLWSHYEPGVLNIQVKGNPAWSKVPWPPTRDFYRVPEPYRSGVEKAIRAMGKWREGDSDPVPDQAASRANDSTQVKAAAIDEIDGPPVPLVEIPRRAGRSSRASCRHCCSSPTSGCLCGPICISTGPVPPATVLLGSGSSWSSSGLPPSSCHSPFWPGQDAPSLRSGKTESGFQSNDVLSGLHFGVCVILVCLPGKK